MSAALPEEGYRRSCCFCCPLCLHCSREWRMPFVITTGPAAGPLGSPAPWLLLCCMPGQFCNLMPSCKMCVLPIYCCISSVLYFPGNCSSLYPILLPLGKSVGGGLELNCFRWMDISFVIQADCQTLLFAEGF